MRKVKGMQWMKRMAFALAFAGMFFCCGLTGRAETTAKVVARSANIRQEANASSDALASVVADNTLSVIGKVTGADGKIWYQVFVDANQKGYIRSDLVTVADEASVPTLEGGASSAGSTTETPAQTSTSTASATVDPTGAIEVMPVSGTVSGASTVNVRATASKNGGWVAAAQRNTSVTVTGYIDAGDGKWYLLNYMDGGKRVEGFIRSDYVKLNGDLVDAAAAPEEPEEPELPPENDGNYESPAEPEDKPYDVGIVNDKWYLFDYNGGKQYAIEDFVNAVDSYKVKLADTEDKLKGKNITIALLIVFLAVLAFVVVILVYRSMSGGGDEYPPRGEKTSARRTEGGNRHGQVRRAAPGAGQERRRPAQAQPRQGQTASRPSKPANSSEHDIRVKEPVQAKEAAPAVKDGVSDDTKVFVKEPVKAAQTAGQEKPAKQEEPAKQERKPKNFLEEEDMDEFEFLNWSGDEEI